jgi:Schlafen, AlbA_2
VDVTPPRDWNELKALIGCPESSRLDFKEGLIANPKISKAIAAMSFAGGAIVFGVAQDKQSGLAIALAPIADIAKAEERIGQVVASSITPPPRVLIKAIRDPEKPGQGVIVVTVSRSVIGPHMVDGRFPARSGTTTRWLSAEEVAAMHRGREESLPKPSELLGDASLLPGIPEIRVRSVFEGFGQLRVCARPRDAALKHPDTPWLADALADATVSARNLASQRLAIYAPTLLLSKLEKWQAEGTIGWIAGRAGQSPEALAQGPSVAAVLAYPWRTTIQLTVPTQVPAMRGAPAYLCAFEGLIASELWGALAFFGELYNAEGPVQLDVAAHLAGFQGAVSYHASHAMEGLRVDHLPHATHGDQNLVTVDSEELKSSPEHVARELIERWLVSFYEGDDLLAYVTVPREIGTRLR